ncbi:MAG: succinate dehydrogenase iron-sulfur subunit [Deltaproteobacteria bacterium]|nr:succinate dehydrogenase iron-sulfur subunit [Deltaproteobacteria bacterium]
MSETRILEVVYRVRRFHPEKDEKPYWQEYTIQVEKGATVLDGLHRIRETTDPTLSYRYSCRMGVCGSCGMLISGKPRLACNTQIEEVLIQGNLVTVAPLPNFDVVKDLVPDLAPLFEKHRAVRPHILREGDALDPEPGTEWLQTPQELDRYVQFTYCIRCGLCMVACPTFATDPEYLGPMPLAQAYRYIADSRDGGFETRREIAGTAHGAYRCHYAGECSNVCPKGVDPARAIQLLKREFVLSYLKVIRHRGKASRSEGPIAGAERKAGVPEAPAYTIEQKPLT